jgi:hypothetical protein
MKQLRWNFTLPELQEQLDRLAAIRIRPFYFRKQLARLGDSHSIPE